MAYLRGDVYIWSDGRDMHLWVRPEKDDITSYARDCGFAGGVAIPMKAMDAFVLMRAAEIAEDPAALKRAQRRAYKSYGGNFGGDALAEAIGAKTVSERVVEKDSLTPYARRYLLMRRLTWRLRSFWTERLMFMLGLVIGGLLVLVMWR